METEKRLIDANELANFFGFMRKMWSGSEIMNVIREADTVDAVEVVHGHWTATDVIIHQAGYGVRYYYHAECKVNPHRLFECENDYCPNCGAKMDGDG